MAATDGHKQLLVRGLSTLAGLGLSLGAPLLGAIEPALAASGATSSTSQKAGSSVGVRVNKDPLSLLRYALPFESKEARNVQKQLEAVRLDVSQLRFEAAGGDARGAASALSSSGSKLVAAGAAQKDVDELAAALVKLSSALDVETKVGTPQQEAKISTVYKAQEAASDALNAVEEAMVPPGSFPVIPEEYKGLPKLEGRATIEMVLKPGPEHEGDAFNVNGVYVKEAKLRMVVDGYNAPITAGNFVDLVNKGFYNNMKIQRSDGFVVQTGDPDPDGKVHGYKGADGKVRKIPVEAQIVTPKTKTKTTPLYGENVDDAGYGGAQITLPFSAYGALGMAREEADAESASSQFFWLLFDSDLTPAGKNMLDGRYTCFGYTVGEAEDLGNVQEGDIISSAKVISGLEKLTEV